MRLRLVARQMLCQQFRETDRLSAQFFTHEVVAARRFITFVEQQVERLQDAVETARQLLTGRNLIWHPRLLDFLFRSRQALINRPISASFAWKIFCRRITSRARLRDALIIHAEGFCGTPRYGQVCNARESASCTTSSARFKCSIPKIRVSVATIFPDSSRKRCSTSLETPVGSTITEVSLCHTRIISKGNA